MKSIEIKTVDDVIHCLFESKRESQKNIQKYLEREDIKKAISELNSLNGKA